MTPGGLVKKLAGELGRTENNLIPLDRAAAALNLRRSTGGRGASATQMTESDAAALLLMVLVHSGGVSPELTARRVQQLWEATPDGAVPRATWSSAIEPDVNAKLVGESLVLDRRIKTTLGSFGSRWEEQANFGDCLTAVIQDCANGQVDEFIRDANPRESFNLKVILPDLTAWIEFGKRCDALDLNGRPLRLSLAFPFGGLTDTGGNHEITTTQEMTIVPLLNVAKALRN